MRDAFKRGEEKREKREEMPGYKSSQTKTLGHCRRVWTGAIWLVIALFDVRRWTRRLKFKIKANDVSVVLIAIAKHAILAGVHYCGYM